MKIPTALALPLLALPGGILLTAAAVFGITYASTKTGELDLDKLRLPASVGLVRAFILRPTEPVRAAKAAAVAPAIAQGLMAILHNEGAYQDEGDGFYPLGDMGDPRGPAIGPGQVLLWNLTRLGLGGDDPTELARVGNEYEALYGSALVYREAWDAADGDLREAIRRYNGSGPKAEAYASRALDFAQATFGSALA